METQSKNAAHSPLSCIHRYYILLKIHYFLYFSAFGMLYPIINITLRSRGLSNSELSYINIIIPFLIFLTNPLFGFIADRSRRYILTFNCVVALCTILCTVLFLLPSVQARHIQANVIYDSKLGRVLDFCASQEAATKCATRSQCGCSYQANCTTIHEFHHKQHLVFPFSMSSKSISKSIESKIDMSSPATCGIQYRVPVEQEIQQYMQKNRIKTFSHKDDSSSLATCEITCSTAHFCQGSRYANQMRFIFLYALLFVLGSTLLNSAVPLGASIGIATLSNPELFGRQRFYGTVGFGIAAFGASRIYKIFKTDLVYIIMFSITTSLCIIVTSFIRIQSNKINVQEKELDDDLSVKKQKNKSHSRLSTLIPLFKKVDVIVFLSLTLVWGMSYAGLDPYLYLYLDEFAACESHGIVGWMSLTSSIAEVIGFFLGTKIIKLIGTNLTSIIILLAFTIRFAGYYYIRQPYFLIFMETMHFFNFGVLYVLIVQKADSIAPPGLAGTLQGIALGVAFGLGRGIGLLIASFIYPLVEPRLLFLIIAIFNLIAAIIFSLYFIITRLYSIKKTGQTVIEDDSKINHDPLLVVSTKNPIDES